MAILYIIHQFYPEFYSGTERFLLNLSSSVQKDGHRVKVVTYKFAEGDEKHNQDGKLTVREYVYKGLPILAVKHNILPFNVHSSLEDPEIYRFALEFMQKGTRYDLVHIAHPMRLASFARAALQLGIPYVITLTDFWMICPKVILQTSSGALCAGPEGGDACSRLCPELPSEFVRARLAMAKEILFGAKAVVSPSRFLANLVNKEFPELSISIIPHGMDFNYLTSNRKAYSIGDKMVFGYCGSLVPHKGVHLLLKAFRDLNAASAELQLYGSCFHETDYFELLHKIADQDQRIHFCGTYKAADMGHLLQGIDVVVVPSVCYESYSLVLHEASACNVPVIASNIGGMAEKIKDSVNGFTFRAGDDADLNSKLRQIVENPEILNQIKQELKQCTVPLLEEEAYLYERLYSTAAPHF